MELRRIIAPFFALAGIALVPWTVWLTVTLPARHVSEHWDAAWVGLDLAEILALAATVAGIYRRAVWVEVTASVAGTLLIADAWFDILLAGSDDTLWIAFDLSRFLSRWADVLRVAPQLVGDRLLHLSAPGERPSERDLVRVHEVPADGEPAGEARDADASA